ncbi:MAG: glycosyltransferase [Alphaproteobacteria bacterium]|nr:glycosyltransferase [Alphaproteobacteria bacterium]MDE2011448.1 glycosyltransferase [Alphaproteobacteria bacterium]MDE2071839.1 glycosyltransferase [Alphaproteobacteria bacterium]
MLDLSLILQYALAAVLVLLALLSTQLATLASLRYFRRERRPFTPALPEAELPRVLVQLPVRDEGGLAVRVASAAARLDWPHDRLEIQLLDDGKAEHHEELAEAVRRVVAPGINFSVLRRGERSGFKAGNLAFGLKHCDAPYVAVFDADFVPPPDFLRRTVPALAADPGLAFVQARWGHANRDRNWLTRAQGMLLDSHFAVEQEARYRMGLPMSFNGTAGVWARAAIDHGGGWTGDTLTEDLDLSMRCALKGWRTALVSDLEVPGELPETAAAWRAQQARWTKGHAQVARKLLPEIWTSSHPLWLKAVMTLQICQFAFYLLAGASAVISLSLMALGAVYLPGVAALGLAVTALGLGASVSYLYMGQAMLGREQAPYLARALVLAIIFPSGLVLANARATFEAFSGAQMEFVRTPKAGARMTGGWRGRPELLAGLLLPAFTFIEQAWSAPFFAVAAAGLLSIGAMGWSGSAKVAAREPAPSLPPAE